MMCFALLMILLVSFPYCINCANILVLETVPSPSHHIWIRTITTALAAAGHNVTSLSPDIEEETPENLHYLHLDKVYDVIYNPEDEDFIMSPNFLTWGALNSYLQMVIIHMSPEFILKGCLKSTGFHQLLAYPDDFKFDLVIYDLFVMGIMLPFVQKFNNPPLITLSIVPSIQIISQIFGGSLQSAYVPHLLNENTDLSTFRARINNFLIAHLDYFWLEYFIVPRLNKLLKKGFHRDVDIKELNRLSKVALMNNHPGLDKIEQAFPNVISVGGLQIQRNRTLNKDLQEVMDNAKSGAILFSLGTNVKSEMLGDARQIEILEAFRALPQYTFIWKFEADSLPVEVPSNVVIKKFVPQNDLLAHPNMKLFISHCGLLSTQESVWYGVPILGLPVFGDNWLIMKLSIKTGVAEQGDLRNIERNAFKKLIEKMINDPKYNENAKIRSKIFRDQKETPLERAIWWIEYVLRHPNMTHMRSQSMDYNIAQRQSWDVLAFLYTVFLVTVLILVKMCCCVCRSCVKEKLKIKKD
ncbi:UDP-glycosyltransferase UGT5-like [Phlebotomus argentipes]|uniref:UDP-glycosyltransferase UGT5-like n=1 Tax=Phlebotomus argentipes TaxID=94469 RepID=UPI002892C3C9|nr:UDP-glycosyltransferase UGT5-like [Phlebotomus argentipes]